MRMLPTNGAKENPLVSTAWLADRLDDERVRIIEVSQGDDAHYREGHIPGAVWWNWKTGSWHETDRRFPTPEEMGARLGRIGASQDETVVIYGDPVQYGFYAFWAVLMCGHPSLRILDGGRGAWVSEGRPLSKEVPAVEAVPYQAGPGDASSCLGRDDVLAKLGSPGRVLLDVRSPEEFSGERVKPPPGFDHGAERAGRIPGAVHLFYRDILNENGTFKAPEELRARFEAAGATPGQAGEVVIYCRTSHRASIVWFAMHFLLGYGNAKIYDGSWTEWGSIVGVPIER